MSRDIYVEVTSAIVAAIEKDPGDPIMPWHRGGAGQIPKNLITDHDYQGVNILNLWVAAHLAGFDSNLWGTYRQWREVGANVRKGEKASVIIFYKQVTKETGAGEDETFRVLKWFNVFNANQVDGWATLDLATVAPMKRIDAVEAAVAATRAAIQEGGTNACYSPALDVIRMPDRARFFDTTTGTRAEIFYAVLLHELTHWTGHPTRCGRDLRNRFGSEAYAMEELVAEFGAAFLCARLGVSPTPREDHAQYVANWLRVLKSDKKAIFTAAAQAQVAVDYIL